MAFYSLALTFIIDALFSWGRMFIALGISIVISVAIGVWAALSTRAERVILPVIDILQTIPILAFFPFALFVFVYYLPGYIGINAAVIFLIITSMLWNIIFGVYESIKTIPHEFVEVANLYRMNTVERLRKIFIPASLPRIVQQSILSWSIGLFYLVTSEIFSYGNAGCCVVQHGIGAALVQYAPNASNGYSLGPYLLGISVFIGFVILTRFLFFKPLEDYAGRYMKPTVRAQARFIRPAMFVSWFSKRISSQTGGTTSAAPAKKKQKISVELPGQIVQPKKEASRLSRYAYYAIAIVIIAAIAIAAFSLDPSLISYEGLALVALFASFARIWVAFALITVVAFPLCVYLVFISKQSSRYILFFQILASIPATILLPLIATGVGNAPYHGEIVAMVIFFLSGIWYVIFSMVASTRTLPNNIFEVKRLFGIRGWKAWKSIYIKAMLPGFITGALTAIAAEWNASIVAESFTSAGLTGGTLISSVHTGIGVLLDGTLNSGNLVLMGVALLNLVVMILLINTFVWKRLYKNVSKVYA